MTSHTSHHVAAGTLAALAFLWSAPAFAQINLGAATSLPTGSQPSGVAVADYDGDGDLDVATTSDTGPDIIEIKLNDGSGSFTAGPTSLLPASPSAQDLVAGDLDGDGDVDLAVAVRDPVGSVLIMTNNGAGLFTNSGSATVGDRPRGLSIGDLEGDGDLDLAVANRDGNSASVLTNDGSGVFSVQTVAVGGETRDTALGDFGGDGGLDLAVTNHDLRTVEIYTLNMMTDTMGLSQTLSVGPLVRPDGVTAADFDNDGDVDLAVATSDQTIPLNQAAIFLNAAGTLSGSSVVNTNGTNTSGIIADDLDCDGLIDLVTVNADSNDISTLQNLGGGTFAAGVTHAAGTGPSEIDTGDLDGDGDADLAVANDVSDTISIFINDSCDAPVCPGDTNGDNVNNIDDIVNAVLCFGNPNPDCAGPGTTGDIDDGSGTGTPDGLANIDDIVFAVLRFGSTCN